MNIYIFSSWDWISQLVFSVCWNPEEVGAYASEGINLPSRVRQRAKASFFRVLIRLYQKVYSVGFIPGPPFVSTVVNSDYRHVHFAEEKTGIMRILTSKFASLVHMVQIHAWLNSEPCFPHFLRLSQCFPLITLSIKEAGHLSPKTWKIYVK